MAFQVQGSFSEFSSSQETLTAYVERLEQYLAANKIIAGVLQQYL